MTSGQPSVDGGAIAGGPSEAQRQRVRVKRRRPRPGHHRSEVQHGAAARARQRAVRIFALSTGVLLLMALGLYFSLSRQESAAPAEGAIRGGAVVAITVV